MEEFFDFMDRDFDGRLTFEEFMGEESTIEKLFKNMDKNGDGFVTKQVENCLIPKFIRLSENYSFKVFKLWRILTNKDIINSNV